MRWIFFIWLYFYIKVPSHQFGMSKYILHINRLISSLIHSPHITDISSKNRKHRPSCQKSQKVGYDSPSTRGHPTERIIAKLFVQSSKLNTKSAGKQWRRIRKGKTNWKAKLALTSLWHISYVWCARYKVRGHLAQKQVCVTRQFRSICLSLFEGGHFFVGRSIIGYVPVYGIVLMPRLYWSIVKYQKG